MSDDPAKLDDLDDLVLVDHDATTMFGDLYPSLAPVAHWQLTGMEIDPIVSGRSGMSEVMWFLDHGVHTVGDVLALDVNEPARWPYFGVTKVQRIADFVERLDASATALLAALIPSKDEPTGTTPPELRIGGEGHDLSVLLDWAQFSAGAVTVQDALTALGRGDAPADVAEVAAATLAVPVPPAQLDPLVDLRDWMSGLNERDAAILHRRLIRFEGSTLDDLGLEFGVTRERIRQVETKLKTRLDGWVASESGRSVRWALHLMSRGLGASAPDSEVPLVGDDGGNSDEFGLLLYLADMVWDRASHQIHRRNFRWPKVSEVPAVDGGPLVDEAAFAELLLLRGVVDEHLDWAIEQVDGLRRLNGTLVFWPGNLVEQAMAALTVHGSPMTDNDIADAFDREFNRRGLRDRMLQDPRIIRVTKDDFALTSWGLASTAELSRRWSRESKRQALHQFARLPNTSPNGMPSSLAPSMPTRPLPSSPRTAMSCAYDAPMSRTCRHSIHRAFEACIASIAPAWRGTSRWIGRCCEAVAGSAPLRSPRPSASSPAGRNRWVMQCAR